MAEATKGKQYKYLDYDGLETLVDKIKDEFTRVDENIASNEDRINDLEGNTGGDLVIRYRDKSNQSKEVVYNGAAGAEIDLETDGVYYATTSTTATKVSHSLKFYDSEGEEREYNGQYEVDLRDTGIDYAYNSEYAAEAQVARSLEGDDHAFTAKDIADNFTIINTALGGKAAKATTLAGYGITDAYTKTQVNDKFGGYLPLGGGTLTGALTINGSNADTANLHFARTSYNYISSPTDSTIHMCPSGIAKSSTTGYVFNSSEFHPASTEAYSLGSSSKRWKNVYASTFNGGGLVLGGSDTDRNILRVSCTTGETVNSTSNYGYTLKFLGSGSGVNNALALYADNSTSASQNLATKWLNDGTMYSRNILPHTDNTHSLGSAEYKWKEIHATSFKGGADSISSNGLVKTLEDLNNIPVAGQLRYNTYQNGSDTGLGLTGSDGLVLTACWSNTTYASQLALDDNGYNLAFRFKNTNWSDWKKLAFADGTGATGTWPISITGNATRLGSSTDPYEVGNPKTPVYFLDGKPKAVTQIDEALLTQRNSGWGLSMLEGAGDVLFSTNRLAYKNPNDITIEYSNDGGSTWLDYAADDNQKKGLCTIQDYTSFYLGKKLSGTEDNPFSQNDMLRITIAANDRYFAVQKFLIYMSESYHGNKAGVYVDVYRSTWGEPDAWITVSTDTRIRGWSGWNSIIANPSSNGGFAWGSSGQPANTGYFRFVFKYGDGESEYTTKENGGARIYNIFGYGDTYYTSIAQNTTLAKTGHLYQYDVACGAIFPGNIRPYTKTSNGQQQYLGNSDYQWYAIYGKTLYEDGTSLANKYLGKTGGTMTGTLTSQNILPGVHHTTSATGYSLGSSSNQFNTTYTRYIDTASNYNLRLKAGGTEHMNMLNGQINISAHLVPLATSTYNLGTSEKKWVNVYATTFNGNATSATKTGDGTNVLYAEKDNEINFGGTSESSIIYFGCRAKDSKTAIPSKFVFGSTTGTAELLAKTYKKSDGTEVSYDGHTHSVSGTAASAGPTVSYSNGTLTITFAHTHTVSGTA